MPIYKQSDITNIFWAMNYGFKVGRDPMGIQNSSIATYACLLPGLTNLTGHIRYYSLYCWLLKEYDKLEIQHKASILQYNFIRRAELAIAFIMKDQNINSVVGANYVSEASNKNPDNTIINLKEGADFESKDKYWSFQKGALGQYYLGSLIYLNLVKMEEERFYLRDKGKELAEAVCKSIKEPVRNLFIKCITNGVLTFEEIDLLMPLALNNITVYSEEWGMLNKLLVTADSNGNNMRADTIKLMLHDINKGVDYKHFVEHRFESYIKGEQSDVSFGWYFYYLCEALHYSIESILCLILNKIDSMHNPPIDVFLDTTTKDILKYLDKEQEIHSTIESWHKDCKENITERWQTVKEKIKNEEFSEAVAVSIHLMLSIYNEYELNKDKILRFERNYNLLFQRGILSECLKTYLSQYFSLSIPQFISTIIKQVMNEHTIVAVSKMGNNNMDLRKFIFEDGCLILVELRYPNETNPRISSLYNFLHDMKYLTYNTKDMSTKPCNMLTEIAHKYLNENKK